MGFLDKLKDIGFGNTGPYGRMNSGATNYANYAKERAGFESERGVTQALAMAARDGKPIPFNVQAEIAEKWGVPLNAVIQRAKGINDEIESTTMKKQLQTLYNMYVQKKKDDPSYAPTESDIYQAAQQVGVTDMRVFGMLKDYIVKMKDQKKFVPLGPGDRLLSVGENNEVKVAMPAEYAPEKPGKESDQWEQLSEKVYGDKTILEQRNKKTGEIKRTVVDTSTGTKSDRTQRDMEQDILGLAKKILGVEAGENLVSEALASKAPGVIAKGQAMLKTMVTEYENKFGKGSAKKIGYDTQGDEKRQKAINTLLEAGEKTTEANIQFVMEQMK